MKAMYKGDGRYSKLGVTMDLLGIKDVSTTRQEKNGTIVWRLPIKINYPGNAEKFIEVASFKTGYVRNQNSGYSNYQLNKRCESEPQYYPDYEWCDEKNMNIKTGKFYQYTTRSCVLIPNEIDRLEYLISYCLKNYYIKNANQVANGGYIQQWYHDHQLKQVTSSKVRELQDRIYELESQVNIGDDRIIDLKAQLNMSQGELSATKVRQDVSVIVNGHRYKVL
jgi:hypothetical protein